MYNVTIKEQIYIEYIEANYPENQINFEIAKMFEAKKEIEELKKEHQLSKYDKQYIESVEDKCSNYFDILNKLKVYFEAKIETENLK